jgi:hypothetical protein
MKLVLASGLSLVTIACSSSSAGGFASDAGGATPPSYGEDTSAPDSHVADDARAPVDAGPLGAACDPHGAPCSDGLLCFDGHTAKGWGCEGLTGCQPDLYGHCYATCSNGAGGEDTCNALGGLCGCPAIEGTDAGWQCTPSGVMVCVHSTR